MSNNDKLIKCFEGIPYGTQFTTNEIKILLNKKCDVKMGSIQPTDHCYNSVSKYVGKDSDLPKIFLKIKRGLFEYVGLNFDAIGVNPYEFGTVPLKKDNSSVCNIKTKTHLHEKDESCSCKCDDGETLCQNIYQYVKKRVELLAEKSNVYFDDYIHTVIESAEGMPLQKYYAVFCEHNADRQYMAKVVKYDEGTREILSDLTNKFDPEFVVSEYISEKEFFDKIKERMIQKQGSVRENRWEEYCYGLYQCAQYLSGNNSNKKMPALDRVFSQPVNSLDFRNYVSEIRELMSIRGVGPAVCYNWLKECNATWLAKPDVHMLRIVAAFVCDDDVEYYKLNNDEALKLIGKYLKRNNELLVIPNNTTMKLKTEEYCSLFIFDWANQVGISAFELDRILFIYTGINKFYNRKDGKKNDSVRIAKEMGMNEKELIERIRKLRLEYDAIL